MATYGPARHWWKSHWTDEEIVFYFEVGDVNGEGGWVLRQIELHGPDRVPTAAASLAELPVIAGDEDREALNAYQATYGGIADQPVNEWDDGFPHEDIAEDEFEMQWVAARSHLEPN